IGAPPASRLAVDFRSTDDELSGHRGFETDSIRSSRVHRTSFHCKRRSKSIGRWCWSRRGASIALFVMTVLHMLRLDEVQYHGFFFDVEPYPGLNFAIALREAFVLAHVFGPRPHQKGLEEAIRLFEI